MRDEREGIVKRKVGSCCTLQRTPKLTITEREREREREREEIEREKAN